MIHRSLKNGVSFPALYKTGNKFDAPLKRYDTTRHLDLCDMLSNFGASPKISLDLYVRAIGMPGKIGIDGSDVEKLCNEGKLQVVRNYCECDTAITSALFLRTQRLRGDLSGEGFLKSARNFLDFLALNHFNALKNLGLHQNSAASFFILLNFWILSLLLVIKDQIKLNNPFSYFDN